MLKYKPEFNVEAKVHICNFTNNLKLHYEVGRVGRGEKEKETWF